MSFEIGTHGAVDVSLRLEGVWEMSSGRTSQVASLQDVASLVTSSAEPKELHELMKPHLALQDLLSILSWGDVCPSEILVRQDTEPDPYLGAGEWEPPFRELVASPYQIARSDRATRYCFEFGDVSEEGLGRWLEDYSECTLGISRAAYVARSWANGLPAEAQVVELGASLEELAHITLDRCPYKLVKQCTGLAGAVAEYAGARYFEWPSDGAQCIADTYNAMKHPDFSRAHLSRSQTLAWENVSRSLCLARYLISWWVAMRMGCPPERMPRASSFGVRGVC